MGAYIIRMPRGAELEFHSEGYSPEMLSAAPRRITLAGVIKVRQKIFRGGRVSPAKAFYANDTLVTALRREPRPRFSETSFRVPNVVGKEKDLFVLLCAQQLARDRRLICDRSD